jgi:hypothetical protein
MMNAAAKINRDISSFFKKAGLTALIVTGVLFASKTLNGYVKVEPDQTYENCIVTTDYEYMGHGRGPYPVYKSKIYYVTVKQEVTEKNEISDHIEGEEYDIKNAFSINDNSISKKKEYLFNQNVPYSYYKMFSNYGSSRVKFYKTSLGRSFPVSSTICSNAQAEKEYRKLDPPVFWYGLYILGIVASGISLLLSIKTKRTAQIYEDADNSILGAPAPFDSKEEALEYFWTAKLQNDKAHREFDKAPYFIRRPGRTKFDVLMKHSGDEKRRFEEHKRKKNIK